MYIDDIYQTKNTIMVFLSLMLLMLLLTIDDYNDVAASDDADDNGGNKIMVGMAILQTLKTTKTLLLFLL